MFPALTPTFTVKIQPPPGLEIRWPDLPPSNHGSSNPLVFSDAMRIREIVFCDEQKCSLEEELDDDDPRSWHWVVYAPSSENAFRTDGSEESSTDGAESALQPVGVVRLVPPPHGPHPAGDKDAADEPPFVKIGRLAVLPEYRTHGLGKVLVDTALKWATHNGALLEEGDGRAWGGLVLIHAQVAVEGWYAKRLDFVTDPSLGRWHEVGIEHVGMWKMVELQSQDTCIQDGHA